MKHLRKLYEQFGVEGYYQQYGYAYTNPHLEQITELLTNNKEKLDYSNTLDFCAGGGEVSLILKALGYEQTTAADPFLSELYQQKVGKKCYLWSFEDVIKGKLKGNYSSIICSFAMHLCPQEQLYPLTIKLFEHSNSLIVITPHKRPQLEKMQGVVLDFEDDALTAKGKKVFLKHYIYEYSTN